MAWARIEEEEEEEEEGEEEEEAGRANSFPRSPSARESNVVAAAADACMMAGRGGGRGEQLRHGTQVGAMCMAGGGEVAMHRFAIRKRSPLTRHRWASASTGA